MQVSLTLMWFPSGMGDLSWFWPCCLCPFILQSNFWIIRLSNIL